MPALYFDDIDFNFTVPVSDHFILCDMPKAPSTFVKVYLYVYRSFYRKDPDFSTAKVGQALSMMESEVMEALNYWKSVGLIFMHQDGEQLWISFTHPFSAPESDPAYASSASRSLPSKSASGRTTGANFSGSSDGNGTSNARSGRLSASGAGFGSAGAGSAPSDVFLPTRGASKVIRMETMPTYSNEEIRLYLKKSDSLRTLFAEVAAIMGEPLSSPNMIKVFSFYDYYRLEQDTILFLVRYCVENGKRDFRYMEKVAMDWSDRGITTVHDAQAYVQTFKVYMPILKAFKIPYREPFDYEKEAIDRWLYTYGFSPELVAEAATRTVNATGKSSFQYAEGIMKNWYARGVKTMEDVAALDREHERNAETAGAGNATTSRNLKKSPFFDILKNE